MRISIRDYRGLTAPTLMLFVITFSGGAGAQPSSLKADETLEFDNGELYVGKLRDGLPDGTGAYTFANGDFFTGEWRAGLMNGVGTFKLGTTENPFLTINGTWRDGLLDGATEIDLISGFPDAQFSSNFVNGISSDDGKLIIRESRANEAPVPNELYPALIETLNMCSFIQFSSISKQYENCMEIAISHYLQNSNAPYFLQRLFQVTQEGLLEAVESNSVQSQREYDWFHAHSAVLVEDLGIAVSALSRRSWNFSEYNLLGMQPMELANLNVEESTERLNVCEEFSQVEAVFSAMLSQSTLNLRMLRQEMNQAEDQAKTRERVFLDRTREQNALSRVPQLTTPNYHQPGSSDVPSDVFPNKSLPTQRDEVIAEQITFYEARKGRFSFMKQAFQRENSDCQQEAMKWLLNSADAM